MRVSAAAAEGTRGADGETGAVGAGKRDGPKKHDVHHVGRFHSVNGAQQELLGEAPPPPVNRAKQTRQAAA